MEIPGDLTYSSDHEWVRVEGGIARVGITDYAQEALGDVVYVQLPAVGTRVSAGEACGEVESTKSVSDVFSPVTGTVSAVNEALSDSPEWLNQDPYGQGWIMQVELSEAGEVDGLLDAEGYRQLVDDA